MGLTAPSKQVANCAMQADHGTEVARWCFEGRLLTIDWNRKYRMRVLSACFEQAGGGINNSEDIMDRSVVGDERTSWRVPGQNVKQQTSFLPSRIATPCTGTRSNFSVTQISQHYPSPSFPARVFLSVFSMSALPRGVAAFLFSLSCFLVLSCLAAFHHGSVAQQA